MPAGPLVRGAAGMRIGSVDEGSPAVGRIEMLGWSGKLRLSGMAARPHRDPRTH